MTYSQMFDLILPAYSTQPVTVKRLYLSALIWAGTITQEVPTTTNHANKLAVAESMMAQLQKPAYDSAGLAMLNGANLQFARKLFETYPGGLTSDSDAQTLVNGILNNQVAP